jgi:hypothetical protein
MYIATAERLNPLAKKMAKPTKFMTFVLTILVGMLISWQGMLAVPGAKAPPVSAKTCCCCAANHTSHLASACCAKRANNETPSTPATPPAHSQTDLQVLTAAIVTVVILPTPSTSPLPASANFSPSVTALPIFQRDCCYLL